jgi:hypothetical protein
MSGPIAIVLGEGILRTLVVPTVQGPVLAVQLMVEGGPVPLRAKGLPEEPVALVAVHLHHRIGERHRRCGHVLVRRTTIETDHQLAAGRVLLFASRGDAPLDAATVRPDDLSDGPWLNAARVDAVEGKPVRLELRHQPDAEHGD